MDSLIEFSNSVHYKRYDKTVHKMLPLIIDAINETRCKCNNIECKNNEIIEAIPMAIEGEPEPEAVILNTVEAVEVTPEPEKIPENADPVQVVEDPIEDIKKELEEVREESPYNSEYVEHGDESTSSDPCLSTETESMCTEFENEVKIGYFSSTSCKKCRALFDKHRETGAGVKKLKNGVRLMENDKITIYDLYCKRCRKAKYAEYKQRKDAQSKLDKLGTKNDNKKSKYLLNEKKINDLKKLEAVRDRVDCEFKKDLKKAVEEKSNFQLNLIIK